MFYSMEVNYRMEEFIWYEKLGEPVSREYIMPKEAESPPDWVDGGYRKKQEKIVSIKRTRRE